MSILIVDDSPEMRALIATILAGAGLGEVITATCAAEGLAALEKDPLGIKIVLMDVMMPGIDGLDACRQIKARPHLCHIPVVMVTGRSDDQSLQDAIEGGASDYITKPLNAIDVIARVRLVLKLKDETEHRLDRERGLVRVTRQLEEANQELLRLTVVDALTGVANRRYFDETLTRAWRSGARHQTSLTLIMIDIDHFKAYNDHYGHPAGDECLRQVAKGLSVGILRPDDFFARYGGEEFAVILPGTDAEGAEVVAERLRSCVFALKIPHMASPVEDRITVSEGLACVIPQR